MAFIEPLPDDQVDERITDLYEADQERFGFVPNFTQTFLGYDAIKTGLLFVPMGLAMPIFAQLGAWLAQRFHPRYTVSLGMAIAAFSFYMLRNLEPGMGFFDFAPALILLGAGLGLSMSPLTTAATTAVPINEVGMS